MSKKEQIEEVAKDIMSGEYCGGYHIAEELVNKGYRKIGENEFVISKDGKYRTIEEIEFFVKHNAEVRKQMAEGIIAFLKNNI